jgi:hypothetical protein
MAASRSAVLSSFIAITFATAALAQAPRYNMTVIGATFNDANNPNKQGKALGLNNNGVVVGEWNTNRAFIWTPNASGGTLAFLPGLPDPGPANIPVAGVRINENNQIAGLHLRNVPCCGPVNQVAYWPTPTSEPILVGTLSPSNDGIGYVGGINVGGRVAGESALNPYNRYNAYAYSQTQGETALAQLNGADQGNAAFGINDSNVIVGQAFVGADRRAVRWNTNGTVTNLNTLPNGLVGGSAAHDINNSGVIVGYSFPLPTRAVIWQPGSTTPVSIGALAPNHQSVANAINNAGAVVGRSNDRGFLWTGAFGMIDLTNQVNNLQGHQIIEATDINEAGQITAMARFTLPSGTPVTRAVFLNPVSGRVCDSIDFNNDGARFDPIDITAFLSRFSEGPCVPAGASCNDVDFNNDGSIFDTTDIEVFLSVFSEGPCF